MANSKRYVAINDAKTQGQLDELQKDGVNAIIFKFVLNAMLLYDSKMEPWSRFLQGICRSGTFSILGPLQWIVTECHKRGMELHAWINPYHYAKTKTTTMLSSNHIANKTS